MSLIQPMIDLVNQVPYAHVISYGSLAQQLNTIRWLNTQVNSSSDGGKIDTPKIINSQSSSIVADQTTSGWLVGRLLTGLPESQWHKLPRWRVINKQGYISTLKLGRKGLEQIRLLREEGVEVSNEGYVDMGIYEWRFPQDDLFHM